MLIRLVAVAAAFFGFAALANAQTTRQDVASASVIETIKKRGSIQVGLSTFVPWSFRSKNGDLIGFEVDVARKLAEDTGVKLELVPTAWDGIIPALIAGKFDAIIGSMTPTTKRALTINFTIPYSEFGDNLAANKKLAGNFKTLDDFNSSSVSLACRRGSAPCSTAQKLFPKATLRQFDDEAAMVQEVLNGNAHAFPSAEPEPTFAVISNPDKLFKPFDKPISHTPSAFGVRKGDPDAINFFDSWIRQNQDFLTERYDYWFKTREWANEVGDKK